MATSLAAQLKKLAVPDVQITLGSDFKQASFLYDDVEAAKYDRDHFYNIGVNGLQQLIAKDEKFSEFEDSLYSPSSRTIQRTIQTTEVNKELDATINKFLLRVSPYMQLREAHKAVEWLVNRFNIHLRNVDHFMMCVLPFYDQEPFIMALRILKMNTKECASWRWLESIKNADTFLPKQTLIAHCRSSNGFLGFICKMLSRHIEENTDSDGYPAVRCLSRVITFYTQTVIGVILEGDVSENIISSLIPPLSTGLKASDFTDYAMSSYMILSHLLMSCNLAQPLLESFLNVLCKNVTPDLLSIALDVVVLMYQKQAISKVSKKSLRYLIRQPLLPRALIDLTKIVETEPFMTPFLTALTQKVLKNPNEEIVTSDTNAEEDDVVLLSPIYTLSTILESATLKEKSVAVIVRSLLTWFVSNEFESEMEVDSHENRHSGPFQLFRLLENKFPAVLHATSSVMMEGDDSGRTEEVVKNLKLRSVTEARQELITDPEASLVVCLHHHDASVRKSAVEQMFSEGETILGREDLQSAILSRLQDNNSSIVRVILERPEKLWELFDDKDLLHQTLMKKLSSLPRHPISETHKTILKAMCSRSPDDANLNADITATLLSYLVPIGQDEVSLSLQKELLASKFLANKSLLPPAREVFSKDQKQLSSVDFVYKLVDSMTEYFLKLSSLEELQSLCDCILKSPCPGAIALVIIMTNISLIQRTKKEKMKSAFQKQLISMIVTYSKHIFEMKKLQCPEIPSDHKAVISYSLTSLHACRKLPIEILSFCQQELKVNAVTPELKKMRFWEISSVDTLESNWLWIVMTVFNFLLELTIDESEASAFLRNVFKDFFEVLQDNNSVLKLVCMIVSSSDISPLHKATSLHFVLSYLKSIPAKAMNKLVTDETVPALPFVLMLLSSPSKGVRRVAFKIISILSDKNKESNVLFHWFSKRLLQYRQEIEIDMNFARQVMKIIFEGTNELEPPSPKKRRKSGSKSSSSTDALDFLTTVIVDPNTPLMVTRGILDLTQTLDSLECFQPFMGLLDSLVTNSNQGKPHAVPQLKRELMTLLIKHLTPTVANCVEDKSKSLQTLFTILECESVLESPGETVQLLSASQLNRKFMSALPDASQKGVLSKILDIMTLSSSPEMVRRCRKVVKHMSLDSSLIISELQSVLGGSNAITVREVKRQKVQANTEMSQKDDLDSVCWKRIVLLLEIMQNKKKISNASKLVPVAFQVLAKILEIESDGSGEYVKQLILSTVCKICSSVEKVTSGEHDEICVKKEHLNMELIMQCIRSSNNAHTHHQALLLLSVAAKIAPIIRLLKCHPQGLLLHNLMSIFIFMGVNILRQDNEYSFHVIGKILENVIPAIIMACESKTITKKTPDKKKKSSTEKCATDVAPSEMSQSVMTVILRVFVDAIPHIPSHRKIVLFQKLMSVVGVENYLWRLMLLYIESVVKRPKVATENMDSDEKSSGPMTSTDIEFLSSLSEEYSSSQLFQCVAHALDYVMQLPEDLKLDDKKKLKEAKKPNITLDNISTEDMEIFSVDNHSPKHLRHFKYGTIFALTELLSSQHIVAEMSMKDKSAFLPFYQSAMETVLKFISHVSNSNETYKEEATGKFWKILLNKCHDLLDNFVNLLPDSMFIEVVSGLMDHSLPLVQKRALDLLTSKLQYFKDSSLKPQQRVLLLSIVDNLEKIISQNLLPKAKVIPTNEEIVNGQTAIYSIKVLCRILGEANHKAFLGGLKLCIETLQRHSENGMVSASAMLCIAEIISCAKLHAIEHLSQLMPLIIAEIQTEEIMRHEMLLLASITSLQKIIEAVPLFLSPFLPDIITQMSVVSSSLDSENHKPMVFQKVKLICSSLATVTATRKFLPALEKSMETLQERLVSCADCLMSMLKDHIASMSREDLTTFSQDILNFFFTCFDLRITRDEINESDLAVIEEFVIEAFVSLVFKLSEAQFKPILFQIFTWATDEDSDKNRLLVFYKLCHRLAMKLKNLFTLFAGHILKHSAELLDANNKSKTKCKFFGKGKLARKKSTWLLRDVIGCLWKTFVHDTEGFLNKERFDIVMQPLVDQLENTLGKDSVANERVEQYLIPCIASLAAAAHDDVLWKDMNYQILLKTRSQSPKVRMWALSAIDTFQKQLGEDYTQLVPETIPFIAELMEDESEDVEKLTQKVIASMEVSVGENLQEYF